jgi:hypothetical protein
LTERTCRSCRCRGAWRSNNKVSNTYHLGVRCDCHHNLEVDPAPSLCDCVTVPGQPGKASARARSHAVHEVVSELMYRGPRRGIRPCANLPH